jgi:hypothetical protein
LFSFRRVALAEPSLPYAKIKRPVGAKSRLPVVSGDEDVGPTDAIGVVRFKLAMRVRTAEPGAGAKTRLRSMENAFSSA